MEDITSHQVAQIPMPIGHLKSICWVIDLAAIAQARSRGFQSSAID